MKKFVKQLACTLCFLLVLLPYVSKLTDSLFHHHEHNDYGHHFTILKEFHKECPIPSFEFSIYEPLKIQLSNQFYSLCFIYLVFSKLFSFTNSFAYTYLFRAPPLN